MTSLAKALHRSLQLAQQGELAAASTLAARLLMEHPTDPDTLAVNAFLAMKQGKTEDAIAGYRQAIARNPAIADWHYHLARACEAANRHAEASAAYRRALELAPDVAAYRNNYAQSLRQEWHQAPLTPASLAERAQEQAHTLDAAGVAAYQSGQAEAALAHFTQASAAAPDWFQPHWHAGVCLHALRDYPAALAAYRQALALNPNHALLRYHFAKALKDSGDLAAAQDAYTGALQLDPANPEIRYSEGLLFLLRGNWERGWPGYELRFAGSDRAGKEHRPLTALPRWHGEPVPPGSGIVVYAEQGMGDTLQCFRYVAALLQHFGRIKFSVQLPLVSLLQANAPPGVAVVPRIAQAIDESGFTHSLDMLSLPAVFCTTPTRVPAAPYLLAPPRSSEHWRERFATETRPKIGVAWQGGALTFAPARDMGYAELAPLLVRDDIAWVSLQKDCAPPAGSPLRDVSAHLADFSDTAGLIAQLDWIIAVDTAVAHLAGALGKPVWLLNRFESEWRWMHGKTETPWYPSMRIFNQPAPGDWRSVITIMCQHLEQLFPSRAKLTL